MDAGIKERNRYRDISWLMPSVDLESVFLKLGVICEPKRGDSIRAFCPDHHLYTGHKSSDPNWFINTVTGQTFCFTEARGSNIVWIVCRLLKCEPDEAARFLTGRASGSDLSDLEIAAINLKASKLHELQDNSQQTVPIRGLDAIERDSIDRKMSEAAYQFFIHPPEKKYPTNILRETVDRYRVFERTWGFYSNRVVIPYFMRKQIVGFSAIDIIGKQAWMKNHPLQSEKAYRKVRYPENFKSSECLFGFDDCPKGADQLIITEGAREVMKLTQEGFHAVAILGAYLSLTHRKLLGELHPRKIVLMFDGDDAGVAITSRVAAAMGDMYTGKSTVKCFLPRGRDPKTLQRNELIEMIKKSEK